MLISGRRIVVGGVATIVVVGAVISWRKTRVDRDLRKPTAGSVEAQRLERDLEKLRREVRTMTRLQLVATAQSPIPSGQSSDGVEVPIPVEEEAASSEEPAGGAVDSADDETLTQRQRERTRRRAEFLKQKHALEVRDPEWASDTEDALQAAVVGLRERDKSSARLVLGDCQSTMCVVNVDTAAAEPQGRVPMALGRLGFRTFGSADIDDGTGEIHWTIFVQRPGFPLPTPPDSNP